MDLGVKGWKEFEHEWPELYVPFDILLAKQTAD